jgi:hypothetical protein
MVKSNFLHLKYLNHKRFGWFSSVAAAIFGMWHQLSRDIKDSGAAPREGRTVLSGAISA